MSETDTDPNDGYGDRQSVGPEAAAAPGMWNLYRPILIPAVVLLLLAGTGTALTLNGCQSHVADGSSNNSQQINLPATAGNEPLEPTGPIGRGIVDAAVAIERTAAIVVPGRAAEWETKEKSAVSQAAFLGVRRKLEVVSKARDTTNSLQTNLRLKLEGLRLSEQGARLASDPKLLKQYLGIESQFKKVANSSVDVQPFLSGVAAVLDEVEQSRDYASYRPQSFTEDQLQKMLESLEAQTASLNELDRVLDSVVGNASSLSPGLVSVHGSF